MNAQYFRRLLLTCGVVASCLVAANASLVGQGAALPPARDIVTRYVRAIGGAEAQKAVKSIRATGTFELVAQGVSGPIEMMSARPSKMLIRIDVPQVGRIETVFDGKVGWEINPITGPSLMTPRRLTETADDSWFDGALHGADHVKLMTTVAKTTFDNRPAYQVDVTFTSGTTTTEYFDVETGLLLGTEASRETSMGVVPISAYLRDYKKFGALTGATVLSNRMMGIEQVIRISKFEYDTVPANAFDVPPQIKALIK